MKFTKLKKSLDPYLLVIILLAGVFFLIYSWLPYTTTSLGEQQLIFNSPDETANFWSSQHFYATGSLSQFSEASLWGEDIVKPRSFRIINNYLVPVGFLGMPWLYGSIASLVDSPAIIIYLTPLFAVLGIIFLYLLFKNIWGKRVACLSSLLGLVVPGYWYYASKSMMPNVLFLSLLIIGLYFFSQAIRRKYLLNYLLTGLVIGLALLVRPAEIIWVAPLLILASLYLYKQVNWTYIWLVPILGAASFLPMLYYNIILFGRSLDIGYQIQFTSTASALGIFKYLLPFGFDLSVIRYNVVNYLYNLFTPQAWLIIGGLILYIIFSWRAKGRSRQNNFAYLLLVIILSLILVTYYGSWQFSDNPNPRLITIGTSFVRYWLPLYFLSLPLVAYGLTAVFKRSCLAWILVSVAVFGVSLGIAGSQVYQDKQEGLTAVVRNLEIYQHSADLVLSQVESKAIIITKKQDKVFFPARTVIYDLFYDVDYARVRNLLSQYPVYFWDFRQEPDRLADINFNNYQPRHLILVPTDLVYNNMQLYKVNDYQ